eukprot:CAMPEP_0185019242 /NCGR_PEP_ID=MMETSP1103-20130426/1869_1 /TAXON_ID=36769 /ORGANISM="Paraphysomonas bandaiensis, Strain Caron Lab Isolate" /LENGTH=162 /DNA_ID=CAMNT_0027549445 /DNA_START=254 /DNA_END=742 /DNA_ORIENTATION=-
METSREKSFTDMINVMLNSPQWKLGLWKGTLEAQSKQWAMYIPGVSQTEEVKMMKQSLSVLNAMTPEELDSPGKIKGSQKERIAVASNTSTQDVTKVILQFQQSAIVHGWLRMKKQAGEALPKTEKEMATMQQNDPRIRTIASKIMNPTGTKVRSGRRRSAF